jgi:hypothetical protein
MFDEAEQLKPEYMERYNRNVNKLLDDLLWFAITLKAGASTEGKIEQ